MVLRHQPLGQLHDDRVDVESAQVVLALALVAGELADVDRVEGRPEVDEERIVALADEQLGAVTERADRSVHEVVVVRERLRPDVGRSDGQPAGDRLRLHAVVPVAVAMRLAHDRVTLDDVQLRVAEPAGARERVQERLLVADLRLEAEPVADVGLAVARVVDVDVVAGAWVERVEVRPVRRHLAWNPVRGDGQRAGCVLGGPRVGVRVVGRRVERDARCLAVARRQRERNHEGARSQRCKGKQQLAHSESSFWEPRRPGPCRGQPPVGLLFRASARSGSLARIPRAER